MSALWLMMQHRRLSLRPSRAFSSTVHRNFYDKYGRATTPVSGGQVSSGSVLVNPRMTLPKVLKVDKVEALSAGTIAEIWSKHFEKKPFYTSLTIAAPAYSLWWQERARENPMFVIPLSVGQGFCNFLLQHHLTSRGGVAAFATLDDYQRYGPAAPVRLAVNCFDDLLQSKLIGLLMARFDGDILSREQALSLVHTAARFYCTDAYHWVQAFSSSPQTFDFDAFLGYFRERMSNRSTA